MYYNTHISNKEDDYKEVAYPATIYRACRREICPEYNDICEEHYFSDKGDAKRMIDAMVFVSSKGNQSKIVSKKIKSVKYDKCIEINNELVHVFCIEDVSVY